MGKALIFFGMIMLLTAIATRADCDGLTQAQCDKHNQMIDGAID